MGWRSLSVSLVLMLATVLSLIGDASGIRAEGNLPDSSLVAAGSTPGLLEDSIMVRVVPSSITVGVNDTFTLDVNVEASSSKPVDGADVKISFSTTYLDVTAVAGGGSLSNEIKNQVSGGTIWYAAGKVGGYVDSSFLLCRITLKAKAATAGTGLNFTSMEVTGPDSRTYAESGSGCTVVVQGATPTPTNTAVVTRVPSPTGTPTASGGRELALRQGVGGYTGFEDTYLDSWVPGANRGGEAGLRLRSVSERNILLRADLTQLASGAIIESAILTLYQVSGGDTPIEGGVYGVLASWAEMEATWEMATASRAWTVAGCNGAGTDRASAPTFQRGLFPTWRDYGNYPFDFDITALVQAWVNSPSTNHGLLVGSMQGALGELVFGSSEHSQEGARPRLLIRYREGTSATTTPTPTPSPTAGPSPTPTHTPGPKGRIHNSVFADTNGNLEWDAQEPGVSGAAIELRNLSNVLLITCFTSSAGTCSFENLIPDTYRVRLVSIPAGYAMIDPSLATWTLPVSAGSTLQVSFALRNRGTASARGWLPLALRQPTPRPSQELGYDDGTYDSMQLWRAAAVRFTVPERRQVLRLRYHLRGRSGPVQLLIYDANWSVLYRADARPGGSGHRWFDHDVGASVAVGPGDFYLGIVWPSAGDEPQLDEDATEPDLGRSYGNFHKPDPPFATLHDQGYDLDLMIRAVVAPLPSSQALSYGDGSYDGWHRLRAPAACFAVDSFSVNLTTNKGGWNLVSVPLVPASTSLSSFLSSIAGKYDLVQAYYGGAWHSSRDDLTTVDNKMGLWIHVTQNCTLTVDGTAPTSTTISLTSSGDGWNLIGWPASGARPLSTALSSIAGRYDKIYSFDATGTAEPWKIYDVSAPSYVNDLTQLSPGKGYWIHMTSSADLVVSY